MNEGDYAEGNPPNNSGILHYSQAVRRVGDAGRAALAVAAGVERAREGASRAGRHARRTVQVVLGRRDLNHARAALRDRGPCAGGALRVTGHARVVRGLRIKGVRAASRAHVHGLQVGVVHAREAVARRHVAASAVARAGDAAQVRDLRPLSRRAGPSAGRPAQVEPGIAVAALRVLPTEAQLAVSVADDAHSLCGIAVGARRRVLAVCDAGLEKARGGGWGCEANKVMRISALFNHTRSVCDSERRSLIRWGDHRI